MEEQITQISNGRFHDIKNIIRHQHTRPLNSYLVAPKALRPGAGTNPTIDAESAARSNRHARSFGEDPHVQFPARARDGSSDRRHSGKSGSVLPRWRRIGGTDRERQFGAPQGTLGGEIEAIP